MLQATEKKIRIIQEYQTHKKDTGSPEVQVALITERINNLTAHLKQNVKDRHSRYGLIKMVGKRKRQLDYVRQHNPELYQKLIARLDLRK